MSVEVNEVSTITFDAGAPLSFTYTTLTLALVGVGDGVEAREGGEA